MKKVKVIVKDKTILELVEDANKGDVIDLQELVEVDTSYIDSIIESGKDKVYQNKLADVKKALEAENKVIITELKDEIKSIKQQAENDAKLKEKEVDSKYINQINELKNQITLLSSNKASEIESLSNKNKLEISNIRKEQESKYQELENKYNLLEAQVNSQLKQKELEVENRYINEINTLKNDSAISITKKEAEIQELKSKAQLELEQALNSQREKFKEELKVKDDAILTLQRQKASLNVKQTGEDLEAWCNNEVISYMQNGLFNCTWDKDNKSVKNDGEEKGSKADYIFRVYSNETHNELLTSVCLDMKDENPDSKTRQTNEHYYKKLDENRNKKNCKYAVLVSNLELDKPNIIPIFKVRGYEDMYVVRPGYLMVFLNMIASLTTRFSDLLLSKEKETLELRSKLDLITDFNSIKKTYLDDPLELLEKQVSSILKSSETIRKASNDIDNACEKINTSYIKKIIDKLDRFELKLNRTIIKKVD